eukprot:366371-Chlamydomonas_euryale.AAC.16
MATLPPPMPPPTPCAASPPSLPCRPASPVRPTYRRASLAIACGTRSSHSKTATTRTRCSSRAASRAARPATPKRTRPLLRCSTPAGAWPTPRGSLMLQTSLRRAGRALTLSHRTQGGRRGCTLRLGSCWGCQTRRPSSWGRGEHAVAAAAVRCIWEAAGAARRTGSVAAAARRARKRDCGRAEHSQWLGARHMPSSRSPASSSSKTRSKKTRCQ